MGLIQPASELSNNSELSTPTLLNSKDSYVSLLSPPEDVVENLKWRKLLLDACAVDPEAAAAVKYLFHSDIIWAFSSFFFTFDPRLEFYDIQHLPFVPFDFQKDVIHRVCEAIDTGHDIIIFKSREMGVTWLLTGIVLWYFLQPNKSFSALLASRKEELVDKKGDINTLFGKVRYMLYRLPAFLLPEGFNPKRHDRHMFIENPQTGSMIAGEATNPNLGRGSRHNLIILDEYSAWPKGQDKPAFISAAQSTPCRIIVSTPIGMDNHFYELVEGNETGIPVIKLHWTADPRKDEEWYERQKQRLSPRAIAQELDLSFAGSSGLPFFDNFNPKLHITDCEPLPGHDVYAGFDFGYHHPAVLFTQITPDGHWLWLRCIMGKDAQLSDFAEYVWHLAKQWFPHSKFLWHADISGTQKSDKSTRTSIQILQSIVDGPIYYAQVNRPDVALRLREFLNRIIKGQPLLQVSQYKHPEPLPSFVETCDMEIIHTGFKEGIQIDEKKAQKGIDDYRKDGYYEHLFDCAGFIVNARFRHTLPADHTRHIKKFRTHNKYVANKLKRFAA